MNIINNGTLTTAEKAALTYWKEVYDTVLEKYPSATDLGKFFINATDDIVTLKINMLSNG